MHLPVIASVMLLVLSANTAYAQDALRFVTTYVRQLGAIERIRETAERIEGAECRSLLGIRNGERFKLELGSQIANLRSYKLPAQFADLPSNVGEFYKQKIGIWEQVAEVCSMFMAGPKPNVDYDKLGPKCPS